MHQLDVGPGSAVSSLRRAVLPVRDQPQLAQENGEVEQTCRQNFKVPLPLVALASQKSSMVLHCIGLYMNPTLRDWFISEWSEWEGATSTGKPRGSGERVGRRANQYGKSGKKLDMGKGCIRFKSLEDLALDVVGRTA